MFKLRVSVEKIIIYQEGGKKKEKDAASFRVNRRLVALWRASCSDKCQEAFTDM